MSEKKNWNRFNGQQWYKALIHKRTKTALKAREEAFIREHETDSDEELLRVIVKRAQELHHPPRAVEVLGASLICRRFGSWTAAMQRAGYDYAVGPKEFTHSKLYRDEYVRQQELYRKEKAEKEKNQ